MTSADWKQIIQDAASRARDPAMQQQLAELMERATQLALQKAAGQDVDHDIQVVAATAASLGSAEVALAAQAVTEAVWSQLRHLIWTGIFGIPTPP